MKLISAVSLSLGILFCAGGKETKYAGSTPANQVVRTFLGISSADSVDFIRWHIAFENDKYTLRCNYGIGKPNTSGFINGGKWVELTGAYEIVKNYYYLYNGKKRLGFREVNADILHIVNEENNLLIGNGGWSYTLNNLAAAVRNEINVSPMQTTFNDSIAFQGRTPCGVPGIVSEEKPCYKLKWYIVLYAAPKKSESGRYKALSTAWRGRTARVGAWKIIKSNDAKIIYQLDDEHGHPLIHLVKLDDNILAFSDTQGKLLVGDEDFSYTLSRKW
jgi:hypothetical protein